MAKITPIVIWRESKKNFQRLGQKGELVSFTKIHTPVKDFVKQRPYWVGIIKLKDGEKITAQLVVEGRLPKIGKEVIGVLRRLRVQDEDSIIEYGVKFKV